MRIPLSKIYRAFPEFDPFPDEECERYIRYAYRQARYRIGCIPVIIGAAVFAVWSPILVVIVRMVGSSIRPGGAGDWILVALVVSAIAVPGLCALIARDRILLRVLHDRIKTARCPQCEFSLLGLPVANGIARCPECGMKIQLSMHNLTPEDLQIRRVGEADAPDEGYEHCTACGFEVRGVSIIKNTVRCPECGHVEVLHKRAIVNSLYGGRIPHAYVDQHARITICPGCTRSLIGLPIFDGQARCPECDCIASVEPRPGDNQPAAETASDVGLRIKRLRDGSDENRNTEGAEQAEDSRGEAG